MTESELLEKVAELCHDQWCNWMNYLFSRSGTYEGQLRVTVDSSVRWRRQMCTPYAELSEPEKESDRKEARKFLGLIGMTFAEYQEKAMRTADEDMTLEYAALGLGESGEVQNDIKHIVGHGYSMSGKDGLRDKIKEELGDLLWYIAAICSMSGIPMEMMASHNVDAKLQERYPNGFYKKGEQSNEGH